MTVERPLFRLVLRAEAHPVPAVVRLRRALKMLGRVFGFRCVSVEPVAEDARDTKALEGAP